MNTETACGRPLGKSEPLLSRTFNAWTAVMIIAAITAVVSIIGCAATTAKPQDLQAQTSALTDPLNLAHLQRNTQLPAHAALHLSGTMPHEYSDSFAAGLTQAALHRQWHLYLAYHQGNHVQGITLWAEDLPLASQLAHDPARALSRMKSEPPARREDTVQVTLNWTQKPTPVHRFWTLTAVASIFTAVVALIACIAGASQAQNQQHRPSPVPVRREPR